MKTAWILGAFSALALVAGAGSASAAASLGDLTTVVACQNNGVTPTADDCSGFYKNNLLNGGNNQENPAFTNTVYQDLALKDLGFTNWDGSFEDASNQPLGGADPIFSSLLDGIVYVGVHYGAGRGSPGFATHDDTTVFYKLTLSNTNTFHLNFNSSSGARYYFNQPTDPCVEHPELPGCNNGNEGGVPEPATWAMMVMGFMGAGAVIRRRYALQA